MEKTLNERQRLWDGYANEALTKATIKFYEKEGASLYAVPNDEHVAQFIKLFARIIDAQNDGDIRSRQAFFLLRKKMSDFYAGYAAEALILYETHAFVCVRVQNEFMYANVKPWNLPQIKAHAREHNLVYDMRNVELLALKQRYISMQNVVIASF